MSDRWVNAQHDEIKAAARRRREATMAEADHGARERNRRHGR